MKQNYNDCLTRLLKDEGGYSNLAADPGGATNFGITLTDYKRYIKSDATALDVKNMTVDQAKSIYKPKYWDALGCDALPSGVDYTCFDYGVNSGLGRPRKALQTFKDKSGADLINAINNERMAFLRRLKTFPTFGKGWTRRVDGVRAYSLKLNSTKDNKSGPLSAVVVAGAGAAAAPHHFWTAHPYLTVLGALAIATGIGLLVHYVRNINELAK